MFLGTADEEVNSLGAVRALAPEGFGESLRKAEYLSTGATESALYRPVGIVAYGFTPLLMTQEEDASQHSDDERLRESSLRDSAAVFYEVVAETVRGK